MLRLPVGMDSVQAAGRGGSKGGETKPWVGLRAAGVCALSALSSPGITGAAINTPGGSGASCACSVGQLQ